MAPSSALQQAKWIDFDENTSKLVSFTGLQELDMRHSDGSALPLLVSDGESNKFGADIIRFAPGKGVSLHTHIGAHILMVTKGRGILTYNEETHEMFEGMIYLVPSNVPHAIEAINELVLVAVGNDHQPADSESRLDIVN